LQLWDQVDIMKFNRFLFFMWQRKPIFCVARMSSETLGGKTGKCLVA